MLEIRSHWPLTSPTADAVRLPRCRTSCDVRYIAQKSRRLHWLNPGKLNYSDTGIPYQPRPGEDGPMTLGVGVSDLFNEKQEYAPAYDNGSGAIPTMPREVFVKASWKF